ncbi:2,3-bisphosphoglycerate-dependent phosphoglycerate mutase [Peribacillus deserti]|uniref:2,3-bisphosphoglycerate-dependent phosphoglycerate mutase n=1 Tax=Peribacillus deserti TaxID=673318 RepID=A0ABS2QJM6_9BACI|nr:histidine phosphatase family protein [Peribacillus deserti]MBM7692708.1 2,3-bisphosphoglycerate-dependent phosphoglycerate mutase [Peribacillus deserti]
MKILLIRHGESEADLLYVHEGRADFSLTESGRSQVHKLSAFLKENYKIDKLYSSTLKRAAETAGIVGEVLNLEVELRGELMEHNNGVFAGLRYAEAEERYPVPEGGYKMHEGVPEGETEIEFRARIGGAFSRILADNEYETVAMVSHGGAISRMMQSFFKLPFNVEHYVLTGDTGIPFLEDRGNLRVVHFMNSTEHLRR